MKKEYITNGYVLHKRIYIVILCVWFLFAIVTFVLRINEIWHMERKALPLFTLVVLFMITAYMVYMIKSTMIKLEVDDNGIICESAARRGLLFRKTSRFASWKSITAISILDKKKGPLKIDTNDGEIVYWNIVNPRENSELFALIDNGIKRSPRGSAGTL